MSSAIEEILDLIEASYSPIHTTVFKDGWINKSDRNFAKQGYVSSRPLDQSPSSLTDRRSGYVYKQRLFEIDCWQSAPPYQSTNSNWFDARLRCEDMRDSVEDTLLDWGDGHGTAFTIISTHTNDTMTIDSDTLTTSVGGLNIDMTNSSYDTLTELVDYINTQSGYTATRKAPGTWEISSSNSSLQESIGADITSTYEVKFERAEINNKRIRQMDWLGSRPAHEAGTGNAVYRWIIKGSLKWYYGV